MCGCAHVSTIGPIEVIVKVDEATACILEAATHRLIGDKQFSFKNKQVEIPELEKAIGVEGIRKLNKFFLQELKRKFESGEFSENTFFTYEELCDRFREDLERV